MKFTLSTDYKVLPSQFSEGRCKGIKTATEINRNLIRLTDKYESILLQLIESNPGKETLRAALQSKPQIEYTYPTLCSYVAEVIRRDAGKLTSGTINHYKVFLNNLKTFGDIQLKNVSPMAAAQFEKYLRTLGNDQNTLNSKMAKFIAIVHRAIIEKLLPHDCLYGYSRPKYVQTIPDYLTEQEREKFKAIADVSALKYKTAGYYFLLSCYTGYRISDLEIFSFDKSVRDGKIVIRAGKNKTIVMMPLYPKLKEVIDQVKQLPFNFTQQAMRKYVKELATLAGIGRKIKVHTARHTFAIMLMEKGFSLEETAHFLGDTIDVARIYARITNPHIDRKVNELLG